MDQVTKLWRGKEEAGIEDEEPADKGKVRRGGSMMTWTKGAGDREGTHYFWPEKPFDIWGLMGPQRK